MRKRGQTPRQFVYRPIARRRPFMDDDPLFEERELAFSGAAVDKHDDKTIAPDHR
jgi:hypothetical protein